MAPRAPESALASWFLSRLGTVASENPLEILLKYGGFSWENLWETHLEMKDLPLLCLITKWPFCFCGWIQWSENVFVFVFRVFFPACSRGTKVASPLFESDSAEP